MGYDTTYGSQGGMAPGVPVAPASGINTRFGDPTSPWNPDGSFKGDALNSANSQGFTHTGMAHHGNNGQDSIGSVDPNGFRNAFLQQSQQDFANAHAAQGRAAPVYDMNGLANGQGANALGQAYSGYQRMANGQGPSMAPGMMAQGMGQSAGAGMQQANAVAGGGYGRAAAMQHAIAQQGAMGQQAAGQAAGQQASEQMQGINGVGTVGQQMNSNAYNNYAAYLQNQATQQQLNNAQTGYMYGMGAGNLNSGYSTGNQILTNNADRLTNAQDGKASQSIGAQQVNNQNQGFYVGAGIGAATGAAAAASRPGGFGTSGVAG